MANNKITGEMAIQKGDNRFLKLRKKNNLDNEKYKYRTDYCGTVQKKIKFQKKF